MYTQGGILTSDEEQQLKARSALLIYEGGSDSAKNRPWRQKEH